MVLAGCLVVEARAFLGTWKAQEHLVATCKLFEPVMSIKTLCLGVFEDV